MQPTPAFLPGKSHGQRKVAGYRQWGLKGSGTNEQAHMQKGECMKAEVLQPVGESQRIEMSSLHFMLH